MSETTKRRQYVQKSVSFLPATWERLEAIARDRQMPTTVLVRQIVVRHLAAERKRSDAAKG